jgi:hypothetical protein
MKPFKESSNRLPVLYALAVLQNLGNLYPEAENNLNGAAMLLNNLSW